MKNLFKSLLFRYICGWLLCVLLPALLLWQDRLLRADWSATNGNSLVAASLALLVVVVLSAKISRFPGQKWLFITTPIWLLVITLTMAVFLLLRLEYSIYLLGWSTALSFIYTVLCNIYLQKIQQQTLAYIPIGRCHDFAKLAGANWLELREAKLEHNVDAIVADLSSAELDASWQRFLAKMALSNIPVYNNLQIYEALTGRSPIQHLYENNLGSLLPSQSYLYFKRLWESAIIILSLPLTLPLMALTYILIVLESPGGAIFVQQRVGRGGKLFTMYKFRSMRQDSEQGGAQFAKVDDMRVTRVGKVIRKLRIDELPQFINVLKGDMSLIGPRPEQQSFVEEFDQQIPFYSYRHIVNPGITGWAQVMHGYAASTDATMEKIQYDFYYIKHFSMSLDILITIRTLLTMLTGFGAR